MSDNMKIDDGAPPVALCCCGTPLVSTFEVRRKEWYCVNCEEFFEWLHARKGDGPNPTPELDARYRAARDQYDAERTARTNAPELPEAGNQGQPTTRRSAPRATSPSSTTGRAPVAGAATTQEKDPPATQETRPAVAGGPTPPVCPRSERVDGPYHSVRFDGDDPYTLCVFCGEMRDAITGRVIKAGAAA